MMPSFLREMLQTLVKRGPRMMVPESPGPSCTDLAEMAEALMSGRGEASQLALAHRLLEVYGNSDMVERRAFLQLLAEQFGPDVQRLDRAIAAYGKQRDPSTYRELVVAAEPRRQTLLRRLNQPRDGTFRLVSMREDLLDAIETQPALAEIDADFVHLFTSWFNRGFLVLESINWDSPAAVLEKIIQHEAVHTIDDWLELRRRLEPPDRRCFAFFHPALADEPLIFVEIALTEMLANAIGPLLATDRKPLAARKATTAVFYSISNCQRGLRGISFGNFLIKQVVEELRRDLPGLQTFATLSPMPGFMKWLGRERAEPDRTVLRRESTESLSHLDVDGWHTDPQAVAELRDLLPSLAARYLLEAKDISRRPIDPVARFHLGNGARIERIHSFADLSRGGIRQSAGVMVSYLYELSQVEANHQAFAVNGKIDASAEVERLARAKPAKRGRTAHVAH